MSKSIYSSDNGKLRQCLAAIIVNLSTMNNGLNIGWPSPIIPQLSLAHPPVGNTKLTEEQISWISGLLPIGGLIIVPFSGILTEKFGRKGFGYLASIPAIIAWLLIIFGTSHVYFLYVARLIGGMGASMGMFIAPLYVSEIACEEIRGALGSLLLLSVKIGILFAYVCGSYLPYQLFGILSLFFPIGFLMAFFFMPETPVYLVRKNRIFQAEQSLMFFKGNNRELVDEELTRLKSQASASNNSTKKINFAHLIRDRATRKGLIISLILIAGQQFSGIFAMINYAEPIFKRAESTLSPEVSSIIIAIIQVVSSYASTSLIERAGRRKLCLISCAGMAICHTIIATFFCLSEHSYNVSSISWLPLIAFSVFMITYCLGMGPIPFVIPSEVFHNDIASFASTACYVLFWAMASVIVKMFGTAIELLGGSCFFIFAGFCLTCFVFCYFLLPETKGRTREDIVRELAGMSSEKSGGEEKAEGEVLMMAKPV